MKVFYGQEYLEWKTEVVPIFMKEEVAKKALQGCTVVPYAGKDYISRQDIRNLFKYGTVLEALQVLKLD